MMAGLPASGKSTIAKKMVDTYHGTGRVNRDDLRKMLFNSKWSNYNEKIVVEIEKSIAKILLDHHRDVVVDDTNLSSKHENLWTGVVEDYNKTTPNPVKFDKHFVDTDIKTCLNRDMLRQESVGHDVILKMVARSGIMKWPDKPIVLVDIDGTLADGSHREHFVKQDPKDWDNYFNEQEKDKPIVHIFKWVAELSKDHTIVIVSGRGAEREMSTRRWFNKIWMPNPLFPELEVPSFDIFTMFFRDKGDRRPDNQVKKEFLKLLPTRPVLIIDDRPVVVRMWK